MKKLLLLLFFVTTIALAGIPLSTNFTVNTALPIDDRMSVADTTARDAIPALKRWEGMLVYSIADGKHYTLIGGITNGDWTELSGGGNLIAWITANPYEIGDTVIQSNRIYVCTTNHTSGTFATDLSLNYWVELSAGVELTGNQTIAGNKTFSDVTLLGYPAGEPTGVNVNGTTNESSLIVSDVASTKEAQTILHRHSTTLEPLILSARSNSDADTEGDVVANQNMFSLLGTGWKTDNYKIFGSMNIAASTLGTLSSTSAPGKVLINTTPNGATVPTAHLTLESDKSSTFEGDIITKGNLTAANFQNQNLLANFSFENAIPTMNWTTSGATVSTSTPSVDGRALQLSLVGLLDINQEIGASAAAFDGVQMLASVYVKTTLQDVYVCALTNAVESVCIKATGSGKFEQIIIPFIGNATSNGIIIKTTSSTSGAVYIDSAFVGASAPFQNVTGESSVSAKISDTGVVSNESLDFINGNCSVSGTSVYTCTFATNYFKSTPNCFVTLDNGTVNPFGSSMNGASTTTTTMIYATFNSSTGAANARPVMVSCQKTGLDLPGSSKIYSQASQDVSWQPCTFSTLAWQGLGTVTNNLLCAKKGEHLKMRGRFTVGTVSASEGRIPLPNNFGSIVSSASVIANQPIGFATRDVATLGSLFTLIQQPSTSYLNISDAIITISRNPATPVNGSALIANNETITVYEMSIPISGWRDDNIINGSFAGIEKCANDYECTDMFSATITNGNAISNQNVPWLSTAIWSPAGTLTLTFNTNLKDGTSALSSNMNCWAIPSTQGQRMSVNTISTSQVIFENRANDGTANSTPTLAYVYCQKGTNDYKPKTAKVASSIGVPTVPGITTSGTGNLIDVFSVSFGATISTNCASANGVVCPYISSIGGASVNHGSTGGLYTLITPQSKTYAKLMCTLSAQTSGTAVHATGSVPTSCTNCASLALELRTSAGALADAFGTISCIGSY